MPCLGQHPHFYYILFRTKDKNYARHLALSNLLAIVIKQIHVNIIAFVYLECKQILSSKIIYPVYLYLQNCKHFFLLWTFYSFIFTYISPQTSYNSARVMSLHTYITQTLHDNNLITRAFKSDYGCAKIAVQWCGVCVTTPP